jgi:hypothetical protein
MPTALTWLRAAAAVAAIATQVAAQTCCTLAYTVLQERY